jgi:hypothetical protein
MLSKNGLYTILRRAIKELTDVEVYQNSSHIKEVVEAKWLFVEIVYFLFENANERLTHLTKPTNNELAFQLGYSNDSSIRVLHNRYVFNEGALEKLRILKQVFNEYTNLKIDRKQLREMIIKEKFTIVDVIDEVIDINKLVGVGLTTLGDRLQLYCYNKIKK